ncbi:MAG: 5-oxoprolinase subunit PxpB [Flavobacteriaceae bacterium]
MSDSKQLPTYKPYGNEAILMEWEARLSESIVQNVLHFKQALEAERMEDILEIIPSNHSLLVIYRNPIDFKRTQKDLATIFNALPDENPLQKRVLWKIPVCYDLSFGIDLEEISERNQLSIEEIIRIHTQPQYTVFSIGFLPGFLYLGGLNPKLHIDRKAQPRLRIQKGSVGIGGQQTGIYPTDSPGGWQLIGHSPLLFFDISNPRPCFAQVGDRIQLEAISLEEHSKIRTAIQNNDYSLKPLIG